MGHLELQRSLEIKTAYVLSEYKKIVAEFFPECASLDEFTKLFSSVFTAYQNSNARKMDPESIREQKVSCSSAAALLGVWWLEHYPHLTPVFLIQSTANLDQPRSSAHVNVALPTQRSISSLEAVKAFEDPRRSRTDIQLVDWTTHSGMKASNPSQIYEVYPVSGLDSYIKNRLKALKLPKKYSTTRGMLAGV